MLRYLDQLLLEGPLGKGTLMISKVPYLRSLNILQGPLKMLRYFEQLLLEGPLGKGTLMPFKAPY
jgi:hypothetical protein